MRGSDVISLGLLYRLDDVNSAPTCSLLMLLWRTEPILLLRGAPGNDRPDIFHQWVQSQKTEDLVLLLKSWTWFLISSLSSVHLSEFSYYCPLYYFHVFLVVLSREKQGKWVYAISSQTWSLKKYFNNITCH